MYWQHVCLWMSNTDFPHLTNILEPNMCQALYWAQGHGGEQKQKQNPHWHRDYNPKVGETIKN